MKLGLACQQLCRCNRRSWTDRERQLGQPPRRSEWGRTGYVTLGAVRAARVCLEGCRKLLIPTQITLLVPDGKGRRVFSRVRRPVCTGHLGGACGTPEAGTLGRSPKELLQPSGGDQAVAVGRGQL